MIPIKINKENLNTYSLESLEYKYLVEIPKEIMDKYEMYSGNYNDDDVDNNRLLSLFTDNNFDVFRYLGSVGESNLFSCEGSLYTANQDKDFIFYSGGYDDFGFIITDEVLEDMVGKRFIVDWRDRTNLDKIFNKYKNKEIGIGDFIQRFLAYGLKRKAEQIKEEEKRERERGEKIKGNELEIKEFNSGEWKGSDRSYGSKNIIYSYGGEYTFSKDFNELFTIEELNTAYNSNYSYGTEKLNWIETLSVKENVSYSYLSQDKKRTYVVKFKKDKMYVDNVCVPKVRSVFFISRASGDTEKLKTLKELSAIKVEFLALTTITLDTDTYSYKNIPIEIKYADKLWEVTFMDKSIKADWKGLELFRYNLQSLRSRFGASYISSIMELFGISKAELFDFMKKTQLLDKLGEED